MDDFKKLNIDWNIIQSFGCLICINTISHKIELYSKNINQILGIEKLPEIDTDITTYLDLNFDFNELNNLINGAYFRTKQKLIIKTLILQFILVVMYLL